MFKAFPCLYLIYASIAISHNHMIHLLQSLKQFVNWITFTSSV